MSRRIVTISYTGLHAGGGVPKFNRDLHSAFHDRECVHFCWDDCPHDAGSDLLLTEWQKARVLNQYLIASRRVRQGDVVVADGFWADGLEVLPLAISHSHGIWSHLTNDDVLEGREPDMPGHHAAQVTFRRRWRIGLGKPMTAVSAFIAEQMRLQWGFTVDRVINNGVDLETYRPRARRSLFVRRPLVIHGVNDRGNLNKGWDHIERVITDHRDVDVLSLDEAYESFKFYSDRPWTKPEVLAQADLVVHPSGFEGNSLFVAESLACGLPVVGYGVGFLWSIRDRAWSVLDRRMRSPEQTSYGVHTMLEALRMGWHVPASREIAVADLSIDRFRAEWRDYVAGLEHTAS